MLAFMSRNMKLGLARFRDDTAGAIAVVFALCIPAFIGAAGVAVDLSQAYNVKVRLANALDKAALAAGSTDGNEAQIEERVQRFFDANYPTEKLGTPFDLDVDLSVQGEVTVSAKSRVDTTFMNILGLDHLDVSVAATVKREVAGLEVVLVMDTTGSMGATAGGTQTKIEAAKQAATTLVNTLYGAQSNVPTLWMGLVPFSQSINVGTSRSSWTTSDTNHYGGGAVWDGCVEARYSGGHDMDDTPPSANLFPKFYNQCSGSYGSTNNWHNGTGTDIATNGNFASSTGWTTGTDWAIASGVLSKNWNTYTVTNGDFAASTGWTLGTGWTVTGGVASKTTTTTSSSVTRTPGTAIVSGQSYRVTFTIASRTAGSVRASVGGTNGPTHNTTGTFTDTIVAGGGSTIGFNTNDGFRGTVDNMTATTTATSTTTSRAPASSIVNGTRYIATFTINNISNGSVRLTVGNDNGTYYSSAGTYTETFAPTSNGGNLTFTSSGSFAGQIDNLTVIPVIVCGTTGTVTYSSPLDSTKGPNRYCTQEMTPLTNDASSILAGIDSMSAVGGTVIPLGLQWGWRMLSPEWRGEWGGDMNANNLPLDYNTPTMNKVIILMTDGDNDFPSNPTYTSYRTLSEGALGTTSKSTADTNLDAKVAALCTSIKSHNIIIYTIAFGTDLTTSSQNMLRSCASKTIYYFYSPTTSSLQSTFNQIAQNLNSLHITH
jgi:Flp pilus assembly protein TadG